MPHDTDSSTDSSAIASDVASAAASSVSTTGAPICTFYDGANYVADESVGHLLFQVMLALRREVEARMVPFGLTDAQWKPLWALKSGQAGTAQELARQMCVDAGAVTRTLDRLEAKGLVERVRSETDRRVVHVRLTASGDAAAAEIPNVLASVNNQFLRGFSETEWKLLSDLLVRMLANGQAADSAQPEENV